jgi:hypothetical protein
MKEKFCDKILSKIEGILLSLEEGEQTYQAQLADLRNQNPHLLVLKASETAHLDANTPCLCLGYLHDQDQTRCAFVLEMCKRLRNLVFRRLKLVRTSSCSVTQSKTETELACLASQSKLVHNKQA